MFSTRENTCVSIQTLMPQLLDVSHASKRGSSLRITIPKKVQEKLDVKEKDIVGFYKKDGKNILKKMDWIFGVHC